MKKLWYFIEDLWIKLCGKDPIRRCKHFWCYESHKTLKKRNGKFYCPEHY